MGHGGADERLAQRSSRTAKGKLCALDRSLERTRRVDQSDPVSLGVLLINKVSEKKCQVSLHADLMREATLLQVHCSHPEFSAKLPL